MALKLDRLAPGQLIAMQDGSATLAFAVLWQRAMGQIEAQEGAQDILISQLADALASMPELPAITIYADYTGTITPADQLPYDIALKRLSGSTDVSTSSTFSVVSATGGITSSIVSSKVLRIATAPASGAVTVSSTYAGIVRTRTQQVTKQVGAVPSGGTGSGGTGTTNTQTAFSAASSATMAAIGPEQAVIVSSTGQVNLSASLSVRVAKTNPINVYPVYGIWRWFNGTAYVNVGTEAVNSVEAVIYEDLELPGGKGSTAGALSVASAKTGLTAGATEKFQLFSRTANGTVARTFTGTAVVTG